MPCATRARICVACVPNGPRAEERLPVRIIILHSSTQQHYWCRNGVRYRVVFLLSSDTDTDTCLLRDPLPRSPTNSLSSWVRFGFSCWIASAHRGTGVAVVLLTHPRALRSHAHGLTGLSV